jgi:hypothetical protein
MYPMVSKVTNHHASCAPKSLASTTAEATRTPITATT